MHVKIVQLMFSEDNKNSRQSLTIKMVSSLTNGQNTGLGLCFWELCLCIMPACRNMLWEATHRIRTNPGGSQTWRCLETTGVLHRILLAYFENNSRQSRHFLTSISIWLASYLCAYWKVCTVTHVLISFTFPPTFPVLQAAQSFVSARHISLYSLTWDTLQAGTGHLAEISPWCRKTEKGPQETL